jgi:DNA-binding transcriptional ArsR family regulator
MPAVQIMLPFARPAPLRVRSCRRPFSPSAETGPYQLPQGIRDQLTVVLRPFRNRDAAFALATFLGRYWSTPSRLALPFPIDRRALTDHAALGLTEARVRGALRTLEEVGFLDRASIEGSSRRYRLKETGELHRCPVLFTFGNEFRPAFLQANERAQKLRERVQRPERLSPASYRRRPSVASPQRSYANSPKDMVSEAVSVLTGELSERLRCLTPASVEDSPLEARLGRVRQ